MKLKTVEKIGNQEIKRGVYKGYAFLITSEPRYNFPSRSKAKNWAFKIPSQTKSRFDYSYTSKQDAVNAAISTIEGFKNDF